MHTADRVGRKFGRLTIMAFEGSLDKNRTYRCRCDCGSEAVVRWAALTSGNTSSCGCLRIERLPRTHGESGVNRTREYRIWANMLSRCRNPKCPEYPDYGGRGILVCERWKLYENFLADMGRAPTPKHSLERERNHEGYSPDNCKWVTSAVQSRNKRNNRWFTYEGETKILKDWSKDSRCMVSYLSLRERVLAGHDFGLALTTPASPGKKFGGV